MSVSRVALEDRGCAGSERRLQGVIHAETVSSPSLVCGGAGSSIPGPGVEKPGFPDHRNSRSTPKVMPAGLRQVVYGSNGCLAAILAEDQNLVLHVNGGCMEPLLRHRERVRVARVAWPLPGDVVAILRSDGTALMHRFLGYVWWKGRWKLMTMADSAARPDALASRTQLLGRIVAREGDRHRVSPRLRVRAFGAWIHWTLRFALRRLGCCR